MSRALIAVLFLLTLGCGAVAMDERPDTTAPELAAATDAWARGDVDVAGREAWRAVREGRGTSALREIGARAALASACTDEALEILGTSREEPLARLRAAAHLARDEWPAAAAVLAALPDAEDDPYTAAIVRVAGAAAGRALWELPSEDALPVQLALRDDLPLPVVAITIEGRATLALVATSAHVTVLSPAMRASDGVLDEISLGALRVRNVPFFVRDLEAESAALGVELGAVIGTDVLLRWGATFEPPSTLRFGGPAPRGGSPLWRLDGSIAAATLRGPPEGGSLGLFVVDTAGAFDVALSTRGAEQLELGPVVPVEGAPFEMGAIALHDVELDGAPLEGALALTGFVDDSVETLTTAPVRGAIGWGVLARGVHLTRDVIAFPRAMEPAQAPARLTCAARWAR